MNAFIRKRAPGIARMAVLALVPCMLGMVGGCGVVSGAADVVSTTVSTVVDVTGDAIKATADAVTPSGR